ncbi:MarR family winged helix-turn-helix transcriptional regulator [Bordetella genomosp. 5]|uniref:MarR family transcriptional regulator n=1 Tax=Bordetella genomosp. 5 TaxID=1395608 RepID=A0A261TM70_9BORD|nr:MarR family transcriptional regulator [Bordetella genomosp. 5]OZI50357.1 MarR family transcriptional regulator [Bordetella genomosp. 5]
MHDHVDRVLADWNRERPDLDVSAMAVCSRLFRLGIVAARSVDRAFKSHGLTQGEFDLLATLHRSGAHAGLSPQQLVSALLLSAGAMTNRLDRLEEAGLIARHPNPEDRRSVIVSLTPEGLRLIRRALNDYLEELDGLLAPLSASERRQLAGLLKRMLIEHDGAAPGGLAA